MDGGDTCGHQHSLNVDYLFNRYPIENLKGLNELS